MVQALRHRRPRARARRPVRTTPRTRRRQRRMTAGNGDQAVTTGAGSVAAQGSQAGDVTHDHTPPSRASVETKGRRYLVEGRLRVLLVGGEPIFAECRGGGELYQLGYR